MPSLKLSRLVPAAAAVLLLGGCMNMDTTIVVNEDGSGSVNMRIALDREKFAAMAALGGTGDFSAADFTCEELFDEMDLDMSESASDAMTVTTREEGSWCVAEMTGTFDSEEELKRRLDEGMGGDTAAVEQQAESLAREVRALAAFDGDAVKPWWGYVVDAADAGDLGEVSVYLVHESTEPAQIVSYGTSWVFGDEPMVSTEAALSSGSFLVADGGNAACLTLDVPASGVAGAEIVAADPAGDAAEAACAEVAAAAGVGDFDDTGMELELRSLPAGGWEFRWSGFADEETESMFGDDESQREAAKILYGTLMEDLNFSFDVSLPGSTGENNAHRVEGSHFIWEFDADALLGGKLEDLYASTGPGPTPENNTPAPDSTPGDEALPSAPTTMYTTDAPGNGGSGTDGSGAPAAPGDAAGESPRPAAETDNGSSNTTTYLLAGGAVVVAAAVAAAVVLSRKK